MDRYETSLWDQRLHHHGIDGKEFAENNTRRTLEYRFQRLRNHLAVTHTRGQLMPFGSTIMRRSVALILFLSTNSSPVDRSISDWDKYSSRNAEANRVIVVDNVVKLLHLCDCQCNSNVGRRTRYS